MNILFIWDKEELPEARKACVLAATSLYPEASFICISKAKKFFSPLFKIIGWNTIKEEMMALRGLIRPPYEWLNPMCFSDWARFWFLAGHPNTLYLDTDCRMKARFEFEHHKEFVRGEGDIHLLYAPVGFRGAHMIHMLKERRRINLLHDFRNKLEGDVLPRHWFTHGEHREPQ